MNDFNNNSEPQETVRQTLERVMREKGYLGNNNSSYNKQTYDSGLNDIGFTPINSVTSEVENNYRLNQEKLHHQSLSNHSFNNGDYRGRNAALRRIEEQRCMEPTQPSSLQFDGRNLVWLENGKPVKSYQAQSGHNRCQNARFTNVEDGGPIPEGYYMLNKDSGQDYEESLWHKINRNMWPRPIKKDWTNFPSSWGHQRIPIQPRQGTDTFGRNGMYIHGGNNGFGSAGCIDLERGMPDFYNDFKNYNDNMSIEVKYPEKK